MRPILLYGSDIWGVNVSANTPIDKLFFYYVCCVLHVKSTTSKVIVVGECGQLPPSVYCHINALCYQKRLSDLPETKIAKQVYNKLDKLHQCGVKTWVTKARELNEQYKVDISSKKIFIISKNTVRSRYQTVINTDGYWRLQNLSWNPILRAYSMFKTEFRFEKYLEAITDCRYRTAMTKLRSCSHTLEIERGRYTKPKTDISEQLCPLCNAMEDEIHFLVNCKLYEAERLRFFSKLMKKIRHFNELDDIEKFILLMSSKDNQIVTWTGKFIYKSFNIRSRFYLNCGGT